MLSVKDSSISQNYWDIVDRISLNNDTSLLSYIVLKGTSLLMSKLVGRKSEYAEKKKKLLEEICEYSKNLSLDCINKMLNQVKDSFLINGYHVKICRIKALDKGLIGTEELFGKIPFEIGLFFDPIYNVPFIPGSSLKGAFKHAVEVLLEKNYKSEEKAKEIAEIIFGSEKWSGLVGVTDAYLVEHGNNGYFFEPDVMTPHYPKAETELDVKPTPVPFLTIARGAVFEFYIYFNKKIYQEEFRRLGLRSRRTRAELGDVNIKDLLIVSGRSKVEPLNNAVFIGDLAEAIGVLKSKRMSNIVSIIPWIDRAVLYAFARGIGAKTSLGYSRFMVLEYKSIER